MWSCVFKGFCMHVWCACVCCVCLCTESVLEFSMLPKLNILLLFFFLSLSFHTLKMYVKYINVQFVRKRQDGETSILNFFFFCSSMSLDSATGVDTVS